MSHNLEIQEGAFFLCDAHFSYKRVELLDFFQDIYAKRLKPTQLFLMGDIVDTLFGGVFYTLEANQDVIDLINKISLNIEIIYLEGNHDFNLAKIFPKVKVFPISAQPVDAKYHNKKILLAHGDIHSGMGYKIYTAFIRNKFLIAILSLVNSCGNNFIIDKLNIYLDKKDDCKEFVGLKEYIYKRLNQYRCDYFIEGHFHQNKTINYKEFIYINLGAFACNQRYFIVKSLDKAELLQENIFSKGH